MKKLILTTLIASSLFSSMRAQEAQNILVVDVPAVITGFYDAQAQEAKFNSEVDTINAQIKEQTQQLKDIQTAAEQLQKNMQDPKNTADGAAMYQKEFNEKVAELNNKETSITTFRNQNLAALQESQNKIIAEEMKKVKDAVGVIAKQHKSTLVLNCNGLTSVVFFESGDVTDEVIALLNKGATPPPSTATLPTTAGNTTASPTLTLPPASTK